VIIAKKNEEKRKVLDNSSNTNIADKRKEKVMHAQESIIFH
jgi:hypothetical protein